MWMGRWGILSISSNIWEVLRRIKGELLLELTLGIAAL
jgi:hypothetical protein